MHYYEDIPVDPENPNDGIDPWDSPVVGYNEDDDVNPAHDGTTHNDDAGDSTGD